MTNMTMKSIAVLLALLLTLSVIGVAGASGGYVCGDCGTDEIYREKPITVKWVVNTPDLCTATTETYPTYCENGHFFANEVHKTVAAGHVFGELNADSYTRSCINCGFTGRG